ncbi:hypothetical protein NDA02_20480 [Leptolyngbya sp. ST-U4]|nr:hypothetical protein [Leptolyngbya sp. FACHB-711]
MNGIIGGAGMMGWGLAQQLLEQGHTVAIIKSNLRCNIPFVNTIHLSFANHIHRFNSTQRSSCRIEDVQSHHRLHNSLDRSVSLLNLIGIAPVVDR